MKITDKIDLVKADLHNHLRTSSRMSGLVNKTVDRIHRKLDDGGIISLVNFDDDRYEKFSQEQGYERTEIENALYFPEKDVTIAKGQEVPTQQGHLLVLGINKGINLKQFRSLEDTIKEAKDNNGIIVIDHPFFIDGLGSYIDKNREILESIDAVEIQNGEAVYIPKLSPKNANFHALQWYEEIKKDFPHLGALISSDGHSLYEIGTAFMRIQRPNIENSEALTETLRTSIRTHNSVYEDEKLETSYIGALDHLADLSPHIAAGAIKKLGRKLLRR